MKFFFRSSLILTVYLFTSAGAIAQEACVEISIKEQDFYVPIEAVKVVLISDGDSLLGVNNNRGQVCFSVESLADKPIDVSIEVRGKKIFYPSLHPAFLKLSENHPKWIVSIEIAPFDKKRFPRIKKWKNVYAIETFEISSNDSEDAAIFYKRGKQGAFIE